MRSLLFLSICTIFIFEPDAVRARWLSTETGRFTTMDTFPGDQREPMSLHRYVYAENDPVNGSDPTGNQDTMTELAAEDTGVALCGFATSTVPGATKRQLVTGTIWFDVGFDTSIKDTSGYQSKLDREFSTLDTVLTSSCPKWGILWLGEIKKSYDWHQKTPPSPTGYSDKNWPTAQNLGINGHTGGIPLLLTTLPLKSIFEGNLIDANGFTRDVTRNDRGIICNLLSSVDNTVAHETGHYAGYSAGDKDNGEHSSDPNNVMFAGGYYQNALQGDKDYCRKVTALAR